MESKIRLPQVLGNLILYTRKKLNGIWNALSAVKFKPAIYA